MIIPSPFAEAMFAGLLILIGGAILLMCAVIRYILKLPPPK